MTTVIQAQAKGRQDCRQAPDAGRGKTGLSLESPEGARPWQHFALGLPASRTARVTVRGVQPLCYAALGHGNRWERKNKYLPLSPRQLRAHNLIEPHFV